MLALRQRGAPTEKTIILAFRLQGALVILALLAAGQGAEFLGGIAFQIATLYLASNALMTFIPQRFFRSKYLIGAIVVLDVSFVSMCIYFSGNANNDIYLLYFLAIFIAAMSRDLRTTVIAAIVISGVYVWVSISSLGISETLDSRYLLRIPLFFVTAFFAGFLTNQARQREAQQKKERLTTNKLERQLEKEVTREEEITTLYQKLNRQHQELISSIRTGIIVVDQHSVIATFNAEAERLTGLDAQTVLGHSIDKFLELASIRTEIIGALSSTSPQNCSESECELDPKDGRKVKVGVSTSPIFSENGVHAGVIVAMRDMTELGGLRERIRKSERLACLGGTSLCMLRGIREQLKSIIGLASIQCERTDVSDGIHQSAEAILKEIESTDKMVVEAIQFIRRDKKRIDTLDMNEVVQSCVLGLKRDLERRSISANLDLDQYLPVVQGNELQIRQVIIQILLNAIEAVSQNGGIKISTRTVNRQVLCTIEDNGHGIPKVMRKRIFEPLTSTKQGGTGLGLFIARQILDEHGGTIDLKETSDKGSTVEIRLPVLCSENSDAEPLPHGDSTSDLAAA